MDAAFGGRISSLADNRCRVFKTLGAGVPAIRLSWPGFGAGRLVHLVGDDRVFPPSPVTFFLPSLFGSVHKDTPPAGAREWEEN
jgi:hypothetical protein